MVGLYLASATYEHLSRAAPYVTFPNPLRFFYPIMASISVNGFFLTGGRREAGYTTAERPAGQPRLAVEGSKTRRNLWGCERTALWGLKCST